MGAVNLKGKKGVLISLSLLIITLTVLSFATIQSNYRKDFIKESTELSAIDRVNSAVSSAQASVRNIITASGGVNVSVSGTSAVFYETLGSGVNNLDYELFKYRWFYNRFTDSSNITLGNSSKLTLNILPVNLAYTHPNGTKGQSIVLVPSNMNYSKFSINIALPSGKSVNAASCITSVTAGSRSLSVLISDGSTSCSYSGTFDPTAASSVFVNTTVSDKIQVMIPSGTNGKLTINDANKIGLIVITNITLQNYVRPVVVVPAVNITVNLTTFNVVKQESIQLA